MQSNCDSTEAAIYRVGFSEKLTNEMRCCHRGFQQLTDLGQRFHKKKFPICIACVAQVLLVSKP